MDSSYNHSGRFVSRVGYLAVRAVKQATLILKQPLKRIYAHSAVSPFKRNGNCVNSQLPEFPDEILALIFEAGHGTADDTAWFELLVSGVTRKWRDIALSTPRLWSRIRIMMLSKELDFIALYLQRSASLPIEIIIAPCSDYREEDDFVDCTPYTDAITRCSSLSIRPDNGYSYGNVISLLRFFEMMEFAHAPRLSSFEVCSGAGAEYHIWDGNITSFLTFSGGAPMLDLVHLVNPNPFCWYPPLSAVTTLCLLLTLPQAFETGDDIYHLLKSAPSLTHLELQGYLSSEWPDSVNISLPLLRVLSIGTYNSAPSQVGFNHLLNAIAAPTLELLCIRGLKLPSTNDNNNGSTRSNFPNVRTLIMLSYPSDPAVMMNLWDTIDASPLVERAIYIGADILSLVSLLQETDGYGRRLRWPRLHTLGLMKGASANEHVRSFSTNNNIYSPVTIIDLPGVLTKTWESADTVPPQLQAHLDALDIIT